MTPRVRSNGSGLHRGRVRRLVGSAALALTVMLATSIPATAATVSNTWLAKIGSAGANGTAQVQAFGSGTGSIVLKLAKLRPAALLAVVISKGTCGVVGATVATLASIKTTASGSAARTSALTLAQTTAISKATVAPGRIAVRVGSGATRKCGQFAVPSPTIGATIPLGKLPTQVAIDGSGVWVTRSLDNKVSRVDPKTNAVAAVYAFLSDLSINPLGIPQPVDVTTGFGSIWVSYIVFDLSLSARPTGWVLRVDPASGVVIGDPIAVGTEGYAGIAASGEAIWVTNYEGTVSRIDPLTNAVAATIPVGGHPSAIAAGFGSIWVTNSADGHVDRIDPSTNQVVKTIQAQGDARGLAVGAGAVWVANYGTEAQSNGTLERIDPTTNALVATIALGKNPMDVAFGGGSVWVAMSGEPAVIQVDPIAGKVTKRIPLASAANGIAASDHAVWVVQPYAAGADSSAGGPGALIRINY